jgi:hypothetical protein
MPTSMQQPALLRSAAGASTLPQQLAPKPQVGIPDWRTRRTDALRAN